MTRATKTLLLLEQWSRGLAEIAAAQGTERFIPALLASVRRLVDFDFLMVPGGGHGAGESPYGQRRRADFFVRHLMGVEPRR